MITIFLLLTAIRPLIWHNSVQATGLIITILPLFALYLCYLFSSKLWWFLIIAMLLLDLFLSFQF